MSEIWALKESYSTDMSPTTLFTQRDCHAGVQRVASRGGRVYPGWWDRVGTGGVLPAYYPVPSQDPYLVYSQG